MSEPGTNNTKPEPDPKLGYIGGMILGFLFFGASIYYALHSDAPNTNVLICLFGGASGWFVGILISPTSDEQAGQFAGYGKAISAFLSGFVVAKLDQIFEQSFAKPGFNVGPILTPTLLLGITFVIGVLCTFAGRDFGERRRL